ncbi:MAG: SMI1/KNR4 family protein [Treponema sp.]|nr:SMI1/KNR4 family protein [Treponema sp.]
MNWRSVKPLVFETEIEEFELKIKYQFPTSFKELIQLYNGGKPSDKIFNTKATKGRVFNNLLSFNKSDPVNIWMLNDWDGLMSDWNKDGLMNSYVAFAQDPFGNLICFEKSNNHIIFIDHETLSIELVADSFTKFIDSLKKIK